MFLRKPVWKRGTNCPKPFTSEQRLLQHRCALSLNQQHHLQLATNNNHQEPTYPPTTTAFSLLQPQPRSSKATTSSFLISHNPIEIQRKNTTHKPTTSSMCPSSSTLFLYFSLQIQKTNCKTEKKHK